MQLEDWGSMCTWSAEVVVDWLESLSIGEEFIKCFRDEGITGSDLCDLTEQDIKDICPTVNFHLKKQIVTERNKWLKKSDDKVEEEEDADENVAPAFDNNVRTYAQCSIRPPLSRSIDDLITPIQRYVDCRGKDFFQVFSNELLPFICACLNNRTNGSIHFGVSDQGEIFGVETKQEELETILAEDMKECFSLDQYEIVRNCVRPMKLIKVIPKSSSNTSKLSVVEIDIVPASHLCTDEVFFLKMARTGSRHSKHSRVYCFNSYLNPEPIEGDALKIYMNSTRLKLIETRKTNENTRCQEIAQNYSTSSMKLSNFLCSGGDQFDEDLWPILVLSAQNASSVKESKNKFDFINYIDRKIVFDFDDNSLSFEQADRNGATKIAILTVEQFENKNEEIYSQFMTDFKEITQSQLQPWIFCNGYKTKEPYDQRKWNHNRKDGFQEAVNILKSKIPKDRATVIFVLFSKNYKVMLSVAEEFCIKFKNRYIIIAEKKDLIEEWKEWFVARGIVKNAKDFYMHCAVGMLWSQVNETVARITKPMNACSRYLPTSGLGMIVEVDWKSYTDLEILSTNHLQAKAESLTPEDFRKLGMKHEISFYEGNEVDWWNFYFKNHVLTREIVADIWQYIKTLLSGEIGDDYDDSKVRIVTICHDPGAGGTTVAKNMLWILKSEYRCATVLRPTESAADQAIQLFKHGENTKPKPVLLLLDHFDDADIDKFRDWLECKSKTIQPELQQPIVFVLLVCVLRSDHELWLEDGTFLIEHCLKPSEINWFEKKDKELIGRKFNPTTMLSFNVLKNNFSKTYIKSVVNKLMKSVCEYEERQLLKYVSLINTFDSKLRELPSSWFDGLMSQNSMWFRKPWLSQISHSTKVFLNDNTRKCIGLKVRGIRIIHPCLAREIFTTLDEDNLFGGAMLEFLSLSIFNTNEDESLMKLIRDIAICRSLKPDEKFKNSFSNLIEEVLRNPKEQLPIAVEILSKVGELTGDIYVSQHLVRLHISVKNWEEASTLVTRLVEERPTEFVLWDTYGKLFKEKLAAEFGSKEILSSNEVQEAFWNLFLPGVEHFKRELELCDPIDKSILYGYTGQLEIILCFINILKKMNGIQEEHIRELFTVDHNVSPMLDATWDINMIRGCKQLQPLKILAEFDEAIERLKDQPADRQRSTLNKDQIIKLKEGILLHFGEKTNEPPANLSENESCMFRRRRIMSLGGYASVYLTFSSKVKPSDMNVIKELAERNISYKSCATPFDFKAYIFASLAMQTPSNDPKELYTLASLSLDLYSMTIKENEEDIDAYLLVVLLNWPDENQELPLASCRIPDILARWKKCSAESNKNTNPGKPTRWENKTLFLLVKDCGLRKFIPGFSCKARRFRMSPEVENRLQRFQGTMSKTGGEVNFQTKYKGNEYTFDIEINHENSMTSSPGMRHRKVTFAIGFTRFGPKAFYIRSSDFHQQLPNSTSVTPCQWIEDTFVRQLSAEYPDSYQILPSAVISTTYQTTAIYDVHPIRTSHYVQSPPVLYPSPTFRHPLQQNQHQLFHRMNPAQNNDQYYGQFGQQVKLNNYLSKLLFIPVPNFYSSIQPSKQFHLGNQRQWYCASYRVVAKDMQHAM